MFLRLYSRLWRPTASYPQVDRRSQTAGEDLTHGSGSKLMRFLYEGATQYSEFEEAKLRKFDERIANMEIPER